MTQRPYVLAFDMDGVLFDTESVKLAAFLDAFVPFCGGDDAVVEKIQAYNAAHRGIPRAEKIRFVLTHLLGRPMHGGDADNVAARYAAFLAQRLPRCAPMDGLTEFLAEVDAIRYVVSSAPPTWRQPARPALDSSPSTPTLASPRSSTSTSMTSPRSTASASTDWSAPPPSTTLHAPASRADPGALRAAITAISFACGWR